LAEGRTLICATHRLTGVANNADLIVVMQNGVIVETGSHDALLLAKKHYWQLWKQIASD
jgi:ATP-binding cassette subfamily B protein